MRVLNLSLDEKVLEEDSAVQQRLIALAEWTGEITVFVPGSRSIKESLSPQLTVHAFGGPKLLQFFRIWTRANKELKKKQYDLVTVQDAYFLGFLAVRLANRFSIPIEVQIHGFEKMEGWRARLARFVLEHTTKIRVVSERLKREITTRYTLHATRFYILPIYTQIHIPPKIFKRKTVPYPFTFLTVGRLVPVKNIRLQIQALAEVAKQIPQVRLRIVGDGPERNNLQQTVNNLQLGDKVIFEGEQKDMNRFYEEANAFLLTSDSEGWGRVVLEAAAHKLPIIMTDVGLAREVIKNEESGFIIPLGDEHELMRAMKEFLDKPELRARLGEGAYRAFRTLPSKEEQIQKQIEAWQALMGENRKRKAI